MQEAPQTPETDADTESKDSATWIELLSQASNHVNYLAVSPADSSASTDVYSSPLSSSSSPSSHSPSELLAVGDTHNPREGAGRASKASDAFTSDFKPAPSGEDGGTALRRQLRQAQALQHTEIGEILALFNATEARGGVQQFGVRPADVNGGNVGDVYVESQTYNRRRHYRNRVCQTWKSSGGRIGSTEIRSEKGSRTFLRKYGCAQHLHSRPRWNATRGPTFNEIVPSLSRHSRFETSCAAEK